MRLTVAIGTGRIGTKNRKPLSGLSLVCLDHFRSDFAWLDSFRSHHVERATQERNPFATIKNAGHILHFAWAFLEESIVSRTQSRFFCDPRAPFWLCVFEGPRKRSGVTLLLLPAYRKWTIKQANGYNDSDIQPAIWVQKKKTSPKKHNINKHHLLSCAAGHLRALKGRLIGHIISYDRSIDPSTPLADRPAYNHWLRMVKCRSFYAIHYGFCTTRVAHHSASKRIDKPSRTEDPM